MLRFNINFADVFRAISDNRASAVAASKLISEGRIGKDQKVFCLMHTVDLAVKHALTILVRNRRGEVVDACEPITDLRLRLKALASYIMDRKVKSRFEDMKNLSILTYSCTCVHLEIPNATRVAGFYRMVQSIIRNMPVLKKMQKNVPSSMVELYKLSLTPEEWVDVSEIEAILSKITKLNMNMQSDMPGRQALTCYEIYFAVESLFNDSEGFNVVDVNNFWTPSQTFDKLPRTKYPRNKLGNVGTLLLERLQIEFNNYLTDLDSDMKVAAMVHPVSHKLGMK